MWVGPPPAALRAGRDKLGRSGSPAGPACPSCRRRAGGARLPADRQGGGGRRRPRNAHRPLAGGARRGARPRRARGRRRFRRRHRLLRALPRASPAHRDPDPGGHARRGDRAGGARMLSPAAPPEGARGVPSPRSTLRCARDERGGGHFRARDRLPRRRHGRVRARRPRLLLPRAERAHPGRASGDRARHRSRPRPAPVADRRRATRPEPAKASWAATRSKCGSMRRIRAPFCRSPVGRAAAAAGRRPRRGRRRRGRRDRHLLRPDDREADRTGAYARRGARPPRGRARETEVGGVITNLVFLRWLVSHPLLRAGDTTTAFLVEHPPLSSRPRGRPNRPWLGALRLNLPTPPPASAPDVDGRGERGAGSGAAVFAPMPGTVIRVLVAPGDRVDARQPLSWSRQ